MLPQRISEDLARERRQPYYYGKHVCFAYPRCRRYFRMPAHVPQTEHDARKVSRLASLNIKALQGDYMRPAVRAEHTKLKVWFHKDVRNRLGYSRALYCSDQCYLRRFDFLR